MVYKEAQDRLELISRTLNSEQDIYDNQTKDKQSHLRNRRETEKEMNGLLESQQFIATMRERNFVDDMRGENIILQG